MRTRLENLIEMRKSHMYTFAIKIFPGCLTDHDCTGEAEYCDLSTHACRQITCACGSSGGLVFNSDDCDDGGRVGCFGVVQASCPAGLVLRLDGARPDLCQKECHLICHLKSRGWMMQGKQTSIIVCTSQKSPEWNRLLSIDHAAIVMAVRQAQTFSCL